MDDADPDMLRSMGGNIYLLQGWMENAQEEVAQKTKFGFGKDTFPSLCCFVVQLRTYAQDTPEILEAFDMAEEKLNKMYGGDPVKRHYNLWMKEAGERMQNALNLDHNLGPLKIDTAFAYYPDESPDAIDFSDWGED